MVKSLLELKAQQLHLDKSMAELLALRLKVAKVERKLKDSHFSLGGLSSVLPADDRQGRAGRS